jgi:hypothetical protein
MGSKFLAEKCLLCEGIPGWRSGVDFDESVGLMTTSRVGFDKDIGKRRLMELTFVLLCFASSLSILHSSSLLLQKAVR